ncbi:hypothetical protein VKT23_011989 [Stygiomarasmius scandens]|uniref:Cytochrome P450 n=1 Tax=Marasmiellus scandens TaxID=2682957 RepID=A0ABR1J8D0_9AGAR
MSTFLALSHHPEVQHKAQKELDAVIGHGRLPSYSDQKDLPYIQAILKEVQRMYPVTPLAMPHRTVSDDIYEGFFLPKEQGTELPDPELYAFGFGRRVCPGKHFAVQSAWIVLASVLATCNITGPLGDDPDKKIDPVTDFVDGLVV